MGLGRNFLGPAPLSGKAPGSQSPAPLSEGVLGARFLRAAQQRFEPPGLSVSTTDEKPEAFCHGRPCVDSGKYLKVKLQHGAEREMPSE